MVVLRREHRFHGRVSDGCGRFAAELIIPGRIDLAVVVPPDWPSIPWPGTLNVRILSNGWPRTIELEKNLGTLDQGILPADVVIPASRIKNNTITPETAKNPLGGIGQGWRALLRPNQELKVPCWVFRRIGSRYYDVLELLSEVSLRKRLSLEEQAAVRVDIIENPATASWGVL